MVTHILGISAFYHDSAAAILRDGEIIAAAQEERFSRKKHDSRFPVQAVEYCLKEAGLSVSNVDYFGFYEKPGKKFERLLENYIAFAPVGLNSFIQAMELWFRSKLHPAREISNALGLQIHDNCLFVEHHESHAASAFYPSPFKDAAILTIDGVGEWATSTLGVGEGSNIILTHETHFPHSLGLLYSAFTYYTGFRVNSGEYKVMGLAPYGRPKYKKKILDHLINVKEDGSFWMDMNYFNYCQGMTMTNKKFHDLFEGPPRQPDTNVTQKDMDLAASVQNVCEEIMLLCAKHLHSICDLENLVMAGGVALNCVGNGKLLKNSPFENIWIQPAAGDAGGALGVALHIWHKLLGGERKITYPDGMKGSLLGPQFNDDEIDAFLKTTPAIYRTCASNEELTDKVAQLLADEKFVGWFQGRMEFGPRALGGRSILGDPRSNSTQRVMNLKTKFRESFRPFAPSVLCEDSSDYFDLPDDHDSPYMLFVAPVCDEKRFEVDGSLAGIELLDQRRSIVPAVTHVDYSARVQTVDSKRNPLFYELITKFKKNTACPLVVNTSFNIRGEPIVCTPNDAYRCFSATHMDALVLGRHILLKSDQPEVVEFDIEKYKNEFTLD